MQPQFLAGQRGPLFAIHYPPAAATRYRASILYIHPFAEELNKARRMAALQAQRFAAAGFQVLVPDLYGCGDSGGDFVEARWEVWLDDLRSCVGWLQQRAPGPVYLWGVRAGALLASELAQTETITALLLWQPLLDGRQMLTQFLRLRVAAAMAGGGKETTGALRERLQAGATVEVAGYELHPELAFALERSQLKKAPVYWFEVVSEPGRPLLATSRTLLDRWSESVSVITAQTVHGEPFWATQEIALAPALLDVSTASLCTA